LEISIGVGDYIDSREGVEEVVELSGVGFDTEFGSHVAVIPDAHLEVVN